MNSMITPHSSWPMAIRRASVQFAALALGSILLSAGRAAVPYDFPALNTASPNYATGLYSDVNEGSTTATADTFKAGDETISATYAYLHPQSPFKDNTLYRDRLVFLLNERFTAWAAGTDLGGIGDCWQSTFGYMLMKRYKNGDISSYATAWEAALKKFADDILANNSLIYDSQVEADNWFNGDIRQAMAVYFIGVAVNNTTYQTKASSVLNNLLPKSVLGDGGIHYVGFGNETPSYHDENVQDLIWWWKITGSTQAKALIDATRHYAVMQNEPSGFTDQSCDIPYKHMYNNLHSEESALWHAYLSNDGYNYYFGKAKETATSAEILNAMLYQSGRTTKTPSDNFGVVYDANSLGGRGRFNGNWGWVVNKRDPQHPGPGDTDNGYDGRMCGKTTFVGAYTLGAIANKTSLKGALDNVCVEFKESTGTETDFSRGSKYRFLTQDENTAEMTRKNFATVSSTYRLSTRTSSRATADWGAGTPWLGQQIWMLTGERVIGLVQIVSDAADTIYGLDARIVFCGGRLNIMGSSLPLGQSGTTLSFGDLNINVPQKTFTGSITNQRFGIYGSSGDDYACLVRLNDAAVNGDTAIATTAGTRRWAVIDCVRTGTAYATNVNNVMKENSTWGVLEFWESNRKVRLVQNLTSTTRTYNGNFNVSTTYGSTSIQRSWNSTVTAASVSNGTAAISESIPAYGHIIVVSSNQADDHNSSWRSYSAVFP